MTQILTAGPTSRGLDPYWRRGASMTYDQAVTAVGKGGNVPEWDRARAGGLLSQMVQLGWITVERDDNGVPTYTRAEVDPTPRDTADKNGQQPTGLMFFGESRYREVQVETVDGERITLRIPFEIPAYEGPREGYAEHARKAFEESKRNPQPASL